MNGPFETERQAAGPVRHILDSPPGTGAWGDGNHRLLEDACTTAGVQLGAYDHRILLWLAGYEPAACAVIAGMIRRAHAAELAEARAALLGRAASLDETQLGIVLAALDDAGDYLWATAQASCEDCNRLDPARCADHTADEERAGQYAAVARQLRQEVGR